MEINELFENEYLELKRELPSNKKLAIEVIALANTKGGKIIIGFDEKTKSLIGITPEQKTEELIANIIHDYCTPNIQYSISYESIEGIPLLIINVPPSNNKPHYLKNKNIGDSSYIRIGSTSRVADQETLAQLIREGKNISYDSEKISKEINLSQSKITQYLENRKKRLGAKVAPITESLLEDLNLIKKGFPTIAGSLLFLKQPQNIPELHNAYIKAARFKGENKGIFIDQQEIAGSLSKQIETAVKFTLRNIKLKGEISGTKRNERYEYPPEIIREAIVNAVIHRDYSIKGSSILLAIYDNRIEVTSPGGLAGQISIDNISERQYNRNPIIAKRMFEMGYFDSWGQGIDIILDWAETQDAKLPEFKDSLDQFTLTLYPEESKTKTKDKPLTTKAEEEIIKYAQKHEHITNREIQSALNLTKMQAQSGLTSLKKKGMLTSYGSGRGTYYKKSKKK